jgi:hypothetical protein
VPEELVRALESELPELAPPEGSLEPELELLPPGEVEPPWFAPELPELVMVLDGALLLIVPLPVPYWSELPPVPPGFWLQPAKANAAQRTRIALFMVDSLFIDCLPTLQCFSKIGWRPFPNNAKKPCFCCCLNPIGPEWRLDRGFLVCGFS